MRISSSPRGARSVHGHLPLAGHSNNLRHRCVRAVERAGLDSKRLPGSPVRMHVHHAGNADLALDAETRGRGEKGAAVPSRKVEPFFSLNRRHKQLSRLACRHTDVSGEFERLKANLSKATSSEIKPRELLKGSVLKPLLLSMALMLLQQFSGINSIIYFTVFIFQKAGSSLDKNVSTIVRSVRLQYSVQ